MKIPKNIAYLKIENTFAHGILIFIYFTQLEVCSHFYHPSIRYHCLNDLLTVNNACAVYVNMEWNCSFTNFLKLFIFSN